MLDKASSGFVVAAMCSNAARTTRRRASEDDLVPERRSACRACPTAFPQVRPDRLERRSPVTVRSRRGIDVPRWPYGVRAQRRPPAHLSLWLPWPMGEDRRRDPMASALPVGSSAAINFTAHVCARHDVEDHSPLPVLEVHRVAQPPVGTRRPAGGPSKPSPQVIPVTALTSCSPGTSNARQAEIRVPRSQRLQRDGE